MVVARDEIVLATRGSRLSLAQAQWVAAALQKSSPGLGVRLLIVHTRGDRISALGAPPDGGALSGADTGEFVREVQAAVLRGEADAAVHSLKDLPLRPVEGLVLAAVPVRADLREALVSRGGERLEELAPGSRVGTSSPRRQAFLRHLRPDLQVLEMRGNLDTRLRRVESGFCDAVVVAAAGLSRLNLSDRVAQYFLPEVFVPAPGQGALAVEVREDDDEMRALIALLDDARTRQAVWAERSMLAALGGGCRVPVGAWGRREEGQLLLTGAQALPGKGMRMVTMLAPVDDPSDLEAARQLGEKVAGELLRL